RHRGHIPSTRQAPADASRHLSASVCPDSDENFAGQGVSSTGGPCRPYGLFARPGSLTGSTRRTQPRSAYTSAHTASGGSSACRMPYQSRCTRPIPGPTAMAWPVSDSMSVAVDRRDSPGHHRPTVAVLRMVPRLGSQTNSGTGITPARFLGLVWRGCGPGAQVPALTGRTRVHLQHTLRGIHRLLREPLSHQPDRVA